MYIVPEINYVWVRVGSTEFRELDLALAEIPM